MELMKEETFGPVVGVMKVKSDEEAILLMNDCEYGLTAAVYSDWRFGSIILEQKQSKRLW